MKTVSLLQRQHKKCKVLCCATIMMVLVGRIMMVLVGRIMQWAEALYTKMASPHFCTASTSLIPASIVSLSMVNRLSSSIDAMPKSVGKTRLLAIR